jgi:hypothetical protein
VTASNEPFLISEGATDAAPEPLKDRLSVPGSPGRRSRRDSASPRLPGSEAPSNEGASPASPPTRRYDRDPFDVLGTRARERTHAQDADRLRR